MKKFNDIDLYGSGKEPGSVAFDVIRSRKAREYFRVASSGLGFLDRGPGTIKIIGVDIYEIEAGSSS